MLVNNGLCSPCYQDQPRDDRTLYECVVSDLLCVGAALGRRTERVEQWSHRAEQLSELCKYIIEHIPVERRLAHENIDRIQDLVEAVNGHAIAIESIDELLYVTDNRIQRRLNKLSDEEQLGLRTQADHLHIACEHAWSADTRSRGIGDTRPTMQHEECAHEYATQDD